MRLFKLFVAIITVIIAFAGLLMCAPVGVLAFGMTGGIAEQVNDMIGGTLASFFGSAANTLYIVFGVLAGISLLLLIFGIRFCNKKPTRFTAVVLWFFYTAVAIGGLYFGFPSDWIFLGVAIGAGFLSILIVLTLATVKLGEQQATEKTKKEKKEKKEKAEKKPKEEKEKPEEKPQEAAPAPAPQPAPAPRPSAPISDAGRIAVTTESPNFAAKIIRDNLKFETVIVGSDVVVATGQENAQKIADELQKNGIKVSKMRKV
jgi:Na+-transporting methylmalonyl-CoA/oxaloacetate decarboxylase gamma subunit